MDINLVFMESLIGKALTLSTRLSRRCQAYLSIEITKVCGRELKKAP